MSWTDILTESTAALAPSGNPLEILPPRERAVLVLLGQAWEPRWRVARRHGPEGGVDLRGRWPLDDITQEPIVSPAPEGRRVAGRPRPPRDLGRRRRGQGRP